MLTASELKAVLRQRGVRLTRRLGQHHLVDAHVVARIVEACRLTSGDTVVEIGAGLGALTEPLAGRAGRVIALEVDPRICVLLAERMRPRRNVIVLCQDVLTMSWGRVRGAVVVGAIPYHITSPILVALAEHRHAVFRSLLVLQEEVARRLLARPGTKAYGRLSVLAQYCWEIRAVCAIPRSAFFPQPEVDSRCLELTTRGRPPVSLEDEPFFFDLVRSAFSHRRKTLANCLAGPEGLRLPRPEVDALLGQAGLPASVRGEALSLEQFARLANRAFRGKPLRGR
jgi:16S rRNA (adenine1518-N6/adenine1519-N6)-dimethyltransferase